MMSRLRVCGLSIVVSSGRAAPTSAAPPSSTALEGEHRHPDPVQAQRAAVLGQRR